MKEKAMSHPEQPRHKFIGPSQRDAAQNAAQARVDGAWDNGYRHGVEAERERCAKIADGWHITKGGYTTLAWAIREGEKPVK